MYLTSELNRHLAAEAFLIFLLLLQSGAPIYKAGETGRTLLRGRKVEESHICAPTAPILQAAGEMPQKGKKRGRAALTAPKEPAFKEARSELQGESKRPRLQRVEMKSLVTGNVAETSEVEVRAEQDRNKRAHTHWLMKSEPESRFEKGVDVKFGIEDLKAQPNQTACWDGVRNYQARNFLKDMKTGQEAFFYHSNCKEPGIAGIIKIVKEAYPDHTQFEKKDPHYDASSTKEKPKWFMVDVQFMRMTKRFIPLAELKLHHQAHKVSGGPLKDAALFTRQRLSVQPLTDEQFAFILSLEEEKH